MPAKNKVIYVKSEFKPIWEEKTIKVPTGEKKKGLFGKEKEVLAQEKRLEHAGWSDSEIDGEKLSQAIAIAIEALSDEGYEVVSIFPVTSGSYSYEYQAQGISSSRRILSETEKVSGGASYGFGYGYSYTEGVTVIARKIS